METQLLFCMRRGHIMSLPATHSNFSRFHSVINQNLGDDCSKKHFFFFTDNPAWFQRSDVAAWPLCRRLHFRWLSNGMEDADTHHASSGRLSGCRCCSSREWLPPALRFAHSSGLSSFFNSASLGQCLGVFERGGFQQKSHVGQNWPDSQ